MKRHGSDPPGADGGQGSSPRKGVDSARQRLDDDGRRRSRSRRSSRRTPESLASMEAAADDAPPSPPKHLWSSRSLEVTCLSFGLNPLKLLDKKIICTNCCKFFESTLRSNISNLSIGKNSKRSAFGKNKQCLRPWYIDKGQHYHYTKRNNMEDFRNYFGEPLPFSPDEVATVDEGGTVEGDSDTEGNDDAIEALSRPTGHSSPTRSQ